MTVPTQHNCAHSPDGWCLGCVQAHAAELERLRRLVEAQLESLTAALDERDGYRKSYTLLQKGMESQAELMDGLKQQARKQAAELDQLGVRYRLEIEAKGKANRERDAARALAMRLAAALDAFDSQCPVGVKTGCACMYCEAIRALAEARSAGVVPGKEGG